MKVDKEKMEIEIGAGIEATVEQFLAEFKKNVTTMSNSGMDIKQIKSVIAKQVQESTGSLGELKKNLRNIVISGVNRAANEGMYEEYKDAGASRWMWVTVSGKPCPDCAERHGQVETWEDWEILGMPQSGFSICQDHCKCKLVPENYQGKGLDKPIIRTLQSPKSRTYALLQDTDRQEYLRLAKEAPASERVLDKIATKHKDFYGDMSITERIDWVREKPDAVYFRIHKGQKQLVFIRDGKYYVFATDKMLKSAYIPNPKKLIDFEEERKVRWVRIS